MALPLSVARSSRPAPLAADRRPVAARAMSVREAQDAVFASLETAQARGRVSPPPSGAILHARPSHGGGRVLSRAARAPRWPVEAGNARRPSPQAG